MTLASIVCLVGLLAPQPSLAQSARPVRPGESEATAEPAAVLNAERAWDGADVLWPLAQSSDLTTARYAIRALGRLEDVKLMPRLLAFTDSNTPAIRLAATAAIAQTLRHVDPQADPELLATAGTAIRRVIGGLPLTDRSTAVAAMGAIAYANANDVSAAEAILDDILDRTTSGDENAGPRGAALGSFESLSRRNARLAGVSFTPETAARLVDIVRNVHANDKDPAIRQRALRTLISIRAMNAEAEKAALVDDDDQVRRLAVQVLGGNVLQVDPDQRFVDLHQAMSDPSLLVRYEAVQSYAKKSVATHACGPLLEALQDDSLHVVLAALDALGTACPKDEDVTTTVAAEARPAPAVGAWQREAHAFVALAKRDRDRAQIVMQAFVMHPVWHVRLYAAKAAAAMEDVVRLERLSEDSNDNVREATLAPLRKLKGDRADETILGALGRSDYQLIRTAALLLKDSPPASGFSRPVADALLRISRDGKETSRDARLALLDALERHGQPDQADDLAPLVKDLDPKVAVRAAEILTKWTAKPTLADPHPVVHTAVREYLNLKECVAVTMANGRRFRLRMRPDEAPVSVGHFLKIAIDDRYYDGLTFHRVEPNFVVQGGSPGGNEYASDQKYFMRDEITGGNVRGAVGLSTRGRNTGDGQFYIMLVDDPRLDGEYTIFADVFAQDMGVVDRLEEGDTLQSVRSTDCHAR